MKALAHVTQLLRHGPVQRPGEHVASGLQLGERSAQEGPEDKPDTNNQKDHDVLGEQADDEVEAWGERAGQA